MNIPLGFIYSLCAETPTPICNIGSTSGLQMPIKDRSGPPGYLTQSLVSHQKLQVASKRKLQSPTRLPAHLRSSNSPCSCCPSPPSCTHASFSSFMEFISDMLVFSVSAPSPSPSHYQPTAKTTKTRVNYVLLPYKGLTSRSSLTPHSPTLCLVYGQFMWESSNSHSFAASRIKSTVLLSCDLCSVHLQPSDFHSDVHSSDITKLF